MITTCVVEDQTRQKTCYRLARLFGKRLPLREGRFGVAFDARGKEIELFCCGSTVLLRIVMRSHSNLPDSGGGRFPVRCGSGRSIVPCECCPQRLQPAS